MSRVMKSTDVQVPVRTAYNQWTQFEDFPQFMDNVQKIRQLDDETLEWQTDIFGVERQFTASITEQDPDQRIAWAADGDIQHAGVVTFHRKSDDVTTVNFALDYEPNDFVEKVGDAVNVIERACERDLENFKSFIESRGQETGAWRGEVEQNDLN